MKWRTSGLSVVALTALAIELCLATAAGAATVTPRPNYRDGTVRLDAAYTEECAEVRLYVDDQLREAISVAPTVTAVRTTGLPLRRRSVFVLKGVDAGGGESWSSTLTLDPATYRPRTPSLILTSRKVVLRSFSVKASNSRPVTKVRARGDETRLWAWTRYAQPLSRFTIPGVRPVRGPSTVEVVAYNGFGRSPVARRLVYWIGSVPGTTRSVVADKQFTALFHVYRGRVVNWWPCAFGKSGTPTPNGDFKIGRPAAASGAWGVLRRRLYRASDGSPTMYYIHGTNAPWSIGTFASHGCIRMYNSDVREFARTVPTGTRVRIH